MTSKLPPLNSLKVFETVAHELSFTLAAQELNVSQGAISKQIKILEDFLGCSLFIRAPHSISLTKAGEKLFKTVHQAFFDIQDTILDISTNNPENKILTINSMPSLSTQWLIPKLDEFIKIHKDIRVNVTINGKEKLDFISTKADLSIQGSNTKVIGDVKKIKIFDETLILICSKHSLINNPIKKIQDIKNHQILEHSSRKEAWPIFFRKNNLENFVPKKTICLEHFFMLTEAVEKNMGLALVPSFFVSEKLKDGSIVNPLGLKYNSNFKYYMIFPKRNEKQNKIVKFIDWIKKNANN